MSGKNIHANLFFIVLIAFGIGGFWTYKVYQIHQNGFATEAVIVGTVSIQLPQQDKVHYCPLVKFINEEQKTISDTLALCAAEVHFSKGDKVSIIYDKTKPKDVFVNDYFANILVPALCFGIGGFFLLILLWKSFTQEK
ncbi:MAG: DUF3592 domain-containing protein [Saprospiraceae bacterium]|nr:DUF3592 domain-containing protein [Saprospiraceae bacterium]